MTPGLLPPLVKSVKGQQKTKAFTLHTWSHLPGKAALFDQLAKLKRTKKKSDPCAGFCPPPALPNASHQPLNSSLSRAVKPSTSSEWLNVEKSVRFTLPPDEVKRRSSSKNASTKAAANNKSQVTFIPPLCPDEIEVFNDYQWTSFENKRCCWSSQSCRQQPRLTTSRPLPPLPPPSVSNACCCCLKSEAFSTRSHSRRFDDHLFEDDVIPDYTDDDEQEEAFKQSFYPSGSMTLPMKSSQDKSKLVSKTPAAVQPSVLKKSTSTDLVLLEKNEDNANKNVKKSLNESGESDPGYESDSTGSKSKMGSTSDGPKATTLPRRSAAVQKTSLDRRKLAEEQKQQQEGFTTLEIISPVRVTEFFLCTMEISILG